MKRAGLPAERVASVHAAQKLARHVFKMRGNKSEAHLSELELAAMLAVAFEKGATWQTRRKKK